MWACNTYKRPGLLDWPWAGAEPGGWGALWGWGARGLGGWLAEGGAGAGPGWPIENALKAATFQQRKRSRKEAEKKTEKKQKKNRKEAETEAETKRFFFFVVWIVFFAFFCGMNCVFLCFVFFVVWFFFCVFWCELCFFCGMIYFLLCVFFWYELCFFWCFFGGMNCVFCCVFLVVWIVFFCVIWYGLCFFLCFLWYELCCFLCFFCGMICVSGNRKPIKQYFPLTNSRPNMLKTRMICFFLYGFRFLFVPFWLYELCFFCAFFVVWIVCFCFCVFFVVWIVFLWYELCFFVFCGVNCVFFVFFGWYELCFLCFFGMGCVFLFFLWYELCFFVFLWYELCFCLCIFLCPGAPEKQKTKHKKAQKSKQINTKKKHKKIIISLEKMKLRPPDDSLRTSGPANVSQHFLFQLPFQKNLSGVSPCQEQECEIM